MKFIKAGAIFGASFLVAWMMIFTFIQQPFTETAPAQLLWYQTPPFPIYYYLLTALAVGLAVGVFVSLYYYVTFSVAARARRRELQDLTDQNALLRAEVERLQKACEDLRDQTQRHDTQRMPAVKRSTASVPSQAKPTPTPPDLPQPGDTK